MPDSSTINISNGSLATLTDPGDASKRVLYVAAMTCTCNSVNHACMGQSVMRPPGLQANEIRDSSE
jgi:hypothetical protein